MSQSNLEQHPEVEMDERIFIQDILLRERKDGSGEFAVLIAMGVSMAETVDEKSGEVRQRIVKRKASLPLGDFTVEEAKLFFPKGAILKDYVIEQYDVTPYKFKGRDGETVTSTKRYKLVKKSASAPSDQPEPVAPKSTTEPVPTEVGEDA